MARTYALQSDFENAVEWGQRAWGLEEPKGSDRLKLDVGILAQLTAEWMSAHAEQGDVSKEEALAQREVASLEHLSGRVGFVVAYLDQLAKWKQHNRYVSLLKRLADID
jgi:hypothetical protein